MFCSLFVYYFINVFFYSIQWSNLICTCFLSLYINMLSAPRGGAFYLSPFILDMSNSKQPAQNPNALDAIVCRNPFCSRGRKAFVTEAALQKHLAVLPQCTRFLLNQQPSQWAFQQPQCTSVTIGGAQGIVNTKCVLRRDVVNDINKLRFYRLERLMLPQ